MKCDDLARVRRIEIHLVWDDCPLQKRPKHAENQNIQVQLRAGRLFIVASGTLELGLVEDQSPMGDT
jgi:hypothetical protein